MAKEDGGANKLRDVIYAQPSSLSRHALKVFIQIVREWVVLRINVFEADVYIVPLSRRRFRYDVFRDDVFESTFFKTTFLTSFFFSMTFSFKMTYRAF